MKKIIIVLLLLINSIYAHEYEQFLQAHEWYKNGDYQKAQIAYEALGGKRPSVWHNAGNCAYKKGDYLTALIYWRRAQQGAMPCHYRQLEHLCMQALTQLGFTASTSRWATSKLYIVSYANAMSTTILQVLFLILWCLLLIILFYHSAKWTRIYMVLLLIGLSIVGSLLLIKYTSMRPQAIVIHDASVFNGPQTAYHVLTKLDAATQVTVLATRAEWHKIKAGTLVGWIKADDSTIL